VRLRESLDDHHQHTSRRARPTRSQRFASKAMPRTRWLPPWLNALLHIADTRAWSHKRQNALQQRTLASIRTLSFRLTPAPLVSFDCRVNSSIASLTTVSTNCARTHEHAEWLKTHTNSRGTNLRGGVRMEGRPGSQRKGNCILQHSQVEIHLGRNESSELLACEALLLRQGF
jgi:hypothetical protein